MNKYNCSECRAVFEIEANAQIKCPQCGNSHCELEQATSINDFNIEELLRTQYGCRGGCSCS